MSLWKIALRSIQQRSLSSALTALSMALGVMLVVIVLVVHGLVNDSFRRNSSLGYNLVVGAKGGSLQLVLNTVFYLSKPVENIPYTFYKKLAADKAVVDVAVPVCLGDYYQDYRVVGTTPAMFTAFEYADGQTYKFASGRNFRDENYFEAVIGAAVAREAKLKVGDTFQPTHGAKDGHQHDPFTIVGVLAPSGAPNDRALFINIEGFYLLDNHAKPLALAQDKQVVPADHDHADHDHAEHDHPDEDHAHAHDELPKAQEPAKLKSSTELAKRATSEAAEHDHADHDHADHDHADHDHAEHDHAEHDHAGHGHSHEPLPENQREVTAVLVRTTSDILAMGMRNDINEGQVAQAVLPVAEITGLFTYIVDPINKLLLGMAMLVVVVSGIGVLVSIYNSMSERAHEIAVLRALGASRQTVLLIVLFESILLSLAGGALGWLLGHLLIAAGSHEILVRTGVAIGFAHFVPSELVIIPALTVLACLAGFLPALTAYRTDVAKALTATP